jgi:hypothetical protein
MLPGSRLFDVASNFVMKRSTQINALLLLLCFLGFASAAVAKPECNKGVSMNIVAHEDDDLLFLSPDLIHDILSGRCVRTVFVTAGDAGKGCCYWKSREDGIRSAYALMAGVSSPWTISDVFISGHRITIHTLRSHSKISLVFLRLPDGNFDGGGWPKNNYQSLRKLLAVTINDITAIDGSNSFNKADDLESTLLKLIKDYRPDKLRTQDINSAVLWDHSDHRAVASLVERADMRYTAPHTFISYVDYIDLLYFPNVPDADFDAKEKAFSVYADHDKEIGCYTCFYNPYFYWLKRQYISNIAVR